MGVVSASCWYVVAPFIYPGVRLADCPLTPCVRLVCFAAQAFRARAAEASANDAHRLQVLCQEIVLRLERQDSLEVSVVTEV